MTTEHPPMCPRCGHTQEWDAIEEGRCYTFVEADDGPCMCDFPFHGKSGRP